MSRFVVHCTRHDANFVVVPNTLAQDARLSFRARGLGVYLLSLPDGSDVNTARLSQRQPEGRDQIRDAMAELRDAGYVRQFDVRGKDGRIRRHVEMFDTPQTEACNPVLGASRHDRAYAQVAPKLELPNVGESGVKGKEPARSPRTVRDGRARFSPASSQRTFGTDGKELHRRCANGMHDWQCPPETCPEKQARVTARHE